MEKKIVSCEIEEGRFRNTVTAVFDDGSEDVIGGYYPDELHYSANEFMGLTEKQANDLMHDRDAAYLRD